jgi:Zn-dependent protease
MPELAGILHSISVWLLPALLAITLHEAAHGYVANALGDPTARLAGRLSLNPLRHIDPVGTIFLPGLMLLVGSNFFFGWAKAVPVDMRYLRSPRRDMAIVAAAGPLINLAMALIAALLLHGLQYMPDVASDWARENLLNAIKFNVILAVFNLMPIPPLDGGRVAVGVLPLFLARPLARLENIGMLIVMGFAFIIPMVSAQAGYPLNPLGWLLSGPINAAIVAILTLAGW